ncbi:hypothetical protein [Arthrobacter sp. KNU40]|uniref:hypothetical protein n=1 Tax=Arthrobacter sp. KNU40 TaxID=3447965 RepID=UPI003F5F5340
MYDNFKLYNYSKSLVSPEGYGRHESFFLSGDIINGFETVIGTGLQVTVKPGNTIIRNGSGGNASAHIASLIADFTSTLATADASNPRIDAIVLYVDTSVSLPSGTPTAANLDGLGVFKVKYVSGTPNASPTAPSIAAIQTAIGSTSYPYTIISNWRVNAGVTALSQDKCTDTRVFAAPTNPRALGQGSFIESGGVASFTASTLNGAIAAGLAWISVGGVLVPQPFNSLNFTMAASKDRYFYVTLGNNTIQAATDASNGGAAPTLPANSVWINVAISGASAITSVKQWGEAAVGVPIYPDNGQGAWRPWNPTFTNWNTGTGGSAGTVATYKQIGKTVFYRIRSTLGTSGQSVSGTITFSLPVTANAELANSITEGYEIGLAKLLDQFTNAYQGRVQVNNATSAFLIAEGAAATFVAQATANATQPFTWGSGDMFVAEGFYEAA